MKYYKNINRNNLGFIFGILFFSVLLFAWLKKGHNLNTKGKCTVGIIDYLGGATTGYRAYYHYEVEGTSFNTYSSIPRKMKHLVVSGKKYVVKYQNDKPENSAIFLNSPLSETVKLGDYINQGCCDSLSNVLDKI